MRAWFRSIRGRITLLVGLLAVLGAAGGLVGALTLRIHAADVAALGREQERAYLVQRLDTSVYAVVMESRGIYVARTAQQVERFGAGLRRHTARIREDMQGLRAVAEGDDLIPPLLAALDEFVRFREDLVRVGLAEGAAAADRMGNNDANRANRTQVNRALDAASARFRDRAAAAAAEMEAEGRWFGWLLLVVPLVALLAGLAAAWFARAGIGAPLARVTAGMDALAAGRTDLTLAEAARADEIGAMARAVEVFRRNAQENAALRAAQEAERARAEGERRAAIEAVGRRIETETRAAVEAIAARLAAMSREAGSLAAFIGTTARDGEALADGARSSLDHATGSAAAAEELSASISEIAGRVEQAAGATRRAVHGAAEGGRAIEGLQQAVERIGEVARLISDIAARTNLLALNATIEAARAGEAGKGFAVVAGEVKALASQTARSTEEIGRQIQAVVSATREAVDKVQDISVSVSEMEGIASAIAGAMTQQTEATGEIARTASGAAAAAQAMTARCEAVGSATGQADARAGALRVAAAEAEAAMTGLRATLLGIVAEAGGAPAAGADLPRRAA
ncbi:methyl-accepting chemotaxis protein [Roseomonas sp. HF4]|uniref:methyl-accepting chemotaxis protein n=1 Tax=Roseomonas sp. HF4 TaxID=2562313 RepID=UPI0014859BB9|nr:methyl-accepting chemotaxis protein [Roseomonas sp. HF4]